jgi:hypothetical protein
MNSFAIILFLVVFYAINIAQPAFMYNEDGSFREFGIRSVYKTVTTLITKSTRLITESQ